MIIKKSLCHRKDSLVHCIVTCSFIQKKSKVSSESEPKVLVCTFDKTWTEKERKKIFRFKKMPVFEWYTAWITRNFTKKEARKINFMVFLKDLKIAYLSMHLFSFRDFWRKWIFLKEGEAPNSPSLSLSNKLPIFPTPKSFLIVLVFSWLVYLILYYKR